MHIATKIRRRLGDVDITGAAALLKAVGGVSAGGGSAPAMPSTSTTVSTQVSTQVNPQISPVMVQQSSPSNSPVNASPQAFAVPQPVGTPVTGAIPGFDNASGYAPSGVPLALTPARNSGVAIAAAVAIAIGAALMLKKKAR